MSIKDNHSVEKSTVGGYGPISSCQVCDSSDLESVIFLGYLPPVNTMRALSCPATDEPWLPAEMLYCSRCHLVQLGYAADPRILFPPEYPYTSGSTRLLRDNFADLYREATNLLGLSLNDFIVDIGSNDGTLLGNFAQAGHKVLGIEPSLTGNIARERGIPTLMIFFGKDAVRQILERHGSAKVVTAANVFAHIHYIHDIVDSLEKLVGDDGIFISESHYLPGLVANLQYDTIYHEHLRYYSLTSLKYLLERHGFRLLHARLIPTHGGSIRVYASKSSAYPVDSSVSRILDEERRAGFTSNLWCASFRKRIIESKLKLLELLVQLKKDGAPLYGIGAPSRASTLINYVGLDEGIMECVLEVKTSMKINKYMPGRNIPVLEESKLYHDQPPNVFVLSWHIAPELAENLTKKGYRGKYVIPLPQPQLVESRLLAG